MRNLTAISAFFFCIAVANAQYIDIDHSLIRSFKPAFSPELKHIDLDNDGDPDLIRIMLFDSIPAYWIDDDDDMKISDREGDLDNDCLIIDRNNDAFAV